jgi:hypothetical protein
MGLIIAGASTTALALCGLILLLRSRDQRVPTALAFLLALPLQPLVFYLVRLPLDGALKLVFGFPIWVAIVSLFYAPLTEEPAKWLVALVPTVRNAIKREPMRIALATGLGFGIGEIWFVAHAFVTSQPEAASAPPWAYGGFLVERLEVCFLHGVFVSLPFVALARGRSFLLAGLAGMVLHFLLNFPIFLARLNVFGLGNAWMGILLLWVLAFVILGAVMVRRLARGSISDVV